MPTFLVKVVLPIARAAKLQDLCGMLQVSTEDVLAAAVTVGLVDWEAVEGESMINPPYRLSDDDQRVPRGRRRFHVTLELDEDKASQVDVTAGWFQEDCLQSGIAHAQKAMQEDREALTLPYRVSKTS